MLKKIIYSALKTPDGTLLESIHPYDYKIHVDKTNGKTYLINGGLDDVEHSNNGDEVLLLKYSDEPHESIRNHAFRIVIKDKKPKAIRISEMSDEHLIASINYLKQTSKFNIEGIVYLTILENEKNFRKL